MRKFLLVTFVGLVLAINLCGFIKEFVSFVFEDTSVETIYTYEE
jgi:hypothetical protein